MWCILIVHAMVLFVELLLLLLHAGTVDTSQWWERRVVNHPSISAPTTVGKMSLRGRRKMACSVHVWGARCCCGMLVTTGCIR